MSIRIDVDPEVLDSEKTNIDNLADEFISMLSARQSAVNELPWQGRAAEAFGELFSQTRQTLDQTVRDSLSSISAALQGAKDGLLSADEQAAAGMSGTY